MITIKTEFEQAAKAEIEFKPSNASKSARWYIPSARNLDDTRRKNWLWRRCCESNGMVVNRRTIPTMCQTLNLKDVWRLSSNVLRIVSHGTLDFSELQTWLKGTPASQRGDKSHLAMATCHWWRTQTGHIRRERTIFRVSWLCQSCRAKWSAWISPPSGQFPPLCF